MRLVHAPDAGCAPLPHGLDQSIAELDAALASMHAGLRGLLCVACDKLAALRSANAEALHGCAVREADSLKSHFGAQRDRDAVLARLAQHLPGGSARPLRLATIAAALPEPAGSRIRARMQGLREAAEQLQKKNQLAADVARKLQAHIRDVFNAIAKANQETVVYGRNGQHEPATARQWVDAVG